MYLLLVLHTTIRKLKLYVAPYTNELHSGKLVYNTALFWRLGTGADKVHRSVWKLTHLFDTGVIRKRPSLFWLIKGKWTVQEPLGYVASVVKSGDIKKLVYNAQLGYLLYTYLPSAFTLATITVKARSWIGTAGTQRVQANTDSFGLNNWTFDLIVVNNNQKPSLNACFAYANNAILFASFRSPSHL